MTDLERLKSAFIELDIKYEFEEHDNRRYGKEFIIYNQVIRMEGTRGSADFYFLNGTKVGIIDCWNQFD